MADRKLKNQSGNSIQYLVPTGWWTTKDFMRVAKISRTTIHRLRSAGYLTPSSVMAGEVEVFLYDENNLVEVKLYKRGFWKMVDEYWQAHGGPPERPDEIEVEKIEEVSRPTRKVRADFPRRRRPSRTAMKEVEDIFAESAVREYKARRIERLVDRPTPIGSGRVARIISLVE